MKIFFLIDTQDPHLDEEQNPRDLIAFFICGLLNNFGYVLMLSAALDLLVNNFSLSTSY